MARVLLILPRLPQPMGAPYLGQQYVAASLLADGHDVKCIDMAAARFVGDADTVLAQVDAFAPEMIGMTLFTYNAWQGYQLAAALDAHFAAASGDGLWRDRPTPLLVAGGPHPTVRPDEPLTHGFDVSVAGEGEEVVRTLCRWLDGGRGGDLPTIAGVYVAGRSSAPRDYLADLDALPLPLTAARCYRAEHYAEGALTVPGGVITSRGCPARCTFCANYVTGRGYRFRSSQNIIDEMVILVRRFGFHNVAFWDDAFTARRPRLEALCDAIMAEPRLAGITWTCMTPANMVKPQDLKRMREAGCVNVNFGIESGDPDVLKRIQKGQRPEQVRAAVEAARAEGMTTVVNFMFGFPDEGMAGLQSTLTLMEQLAPYTDFFNTRGVLVPFPGTPVYATNHKAFGFTDWWLDPARIPPEPPRADPAVPTTRAAMVEATAHDPALDMDFFHYTPEVRAMIARCVRFKAQHNADTVAAMSERCR